MTYSSEHFDRFMSSLLSSETAEASIIPENDGRLKLEHDLNSMLHIENEISDNWFDCKNEGRPDETFPAPRSGKHVLFALPSTEE